VVPIELSRPIVLSCPADAFLEPPAFATATGSGPMAGLHLAAADGEVIGDAG
jgi:hypothetical protein